MYEPERHGQDGNKLILRQPHPFYPEPVNTIHPLHLFCSFSSKNPLKTRKFCYANCIPSIKTKLALKDNLSVNKRTTQSYFPCLLFFMPNRFIGHQEIFAKRGIRKKVQKSPGSVWRLAGRYPSVDISYHRTFKTCGHIHK